VTLSHTSLSLPSQHNPISFYKDCTIRNSITCLWNLSLW